MALVEKLKEFEANTKWIGSHYEQLKASYPDEWVAVWHNAVIEHSKDLSALLDTIKRRYPDDHPHIPVECISTEDVHLILNYQ
jgi:hypothetical protein